METLVFTILDKTVQLNQFHIKAKRVISIGRNAQNDVFIPDPREEVSRFHCMLIREGEYEYYLQDLGSKNTPKLNGNPCYYARMRSGDRIQLGNLEVLLSFEKEEPKIRDSKISTEDEERSMRKTQIMLPGLKKDLSDISQYPEESSLLYKFLTILQQKGEIEDNLEIIVKELQGRYFWLDRIVIARCDQHQSSPFDLINLPRKDLVISTTLLEELKKEKRLMLIEEIAKNPRFKKAPSVSHLSHVLVIPIMEGNNFEGFLYIESKYFQELSKTSFLTLMNLFVRDLTVIMMDRIRIESLSKDVKILQGQIQNEFEFIGHSDKNNDIFNKVNKVVPTNTAVLIIGETGTGKDVLARHIHDRSDRRNERFIPINCAALSENTSEKELFEKFQLAHKGTLFLNEVSELPLRIQAQLLQFVENKKIWLAGESKPKRINVRILSATNQNLEDMTKEGRFREDLYARLNFIQIDMPLLREKKEDIPILAGYFLHVFRARHNKKVIRFSKTFFDRLAKHNWPRNIRELKHTIERAVILTESNTLTPRLLQLPVNNEKILTLAEVEKAHICGTLRQLGGNKSKTYKALGISKQTLFNKLEKYEC